MGENAKKVLLLTGCTLSICFLCLFLLKNPEWVDEQQSEIQQHFSGSLSFSQSWTSPLIQEIIMPGSTMITSSWENSPALSHFNFRLKDALLQISSYDFDQANRYQQEDSQWLIAELKQLKDKIQSELSPQEMSEIQGLIKNAKRHISDEGFVFERLKWELQQSETLLEHGLSQKLSDKQLQQLEQRWNDLSS